MQNTSSGFSTSLSSSWSPVWFCPAAVRFAEDGFFFGGLPFFVSGAGDPVSEVDARFLIVDPLIEDAGLLERRSSILSESSASILRFFDGTLVAIDAFFVEADDGFRALGPNLDGLRGADGEDRSIDDAREVDPRLRSLIFLGVGCSSVLSNCGV